MRLRKQQDSILLDSFEQESEGTSTLREEGSSLERCLRQADTFLEQSEAIDEELESQNKRLEESNSNMGKIIEKMPVFGSLMKSISFHRYKEGIVLGALVGILMFIGLKIVLF